MSEHDKLIRFAAVAEESSFSNAAKRLNVDQPWLSRQVQQLEAQLGFALFVRSTRKVVLTPEGEVLFKKAKVLAAAAEECRSTARSLMRAHNQTLAIGVNPFSYWVPERSTILDGFKARHPRVEIDLVSNPSSRLLSKLRRRTIDFAIVSQPFDLPDLESVVIHSSSISLLTPPEDPLSKYESVPLSSLADRRIPVTHSRIDPGQYDIIYGPLIAAGAEPVEVPEGEPALPFFARNERLPMVCIGWPHTWPSTLADFVHVEIAPPVPAVQHALVRRREPARGLVEHFWQNAIEVVNKGASVTEPTLT